MSTGDYVSLIRLRAPATGCGGEACGIRRETQAHSWHEHMLMPLLSKVVLLLASDSSDVAATCRRESEPAGHDESVELAADLRSDSAPVNSEHFNAKAFCSALTMPDGTPRKPPKGPFGTGRWRSKSDLSKDKHSETGYTRPLSAEHLRCQVGCIV